MIRVSCTMCEPNSQKSKVSSEPYFVAAMLDKLRMEQSSMIQRYTVFNHCFWAPPGIPSQESGCKGQTFLKMLQGKFDSFDTFLHTIEIIHDIESLGSQN